VLKLYFASIFPVHSIWYHEKREGSRSVPLTNGSGSGRPINKHADPPDPDSVPQHCLSVSMAVHIISLKPVCSRIKHLNRDLFGFFYILYSTMPPLRFHCVGGCWDRIQDCCDFGISCQTFLPLDLNHSRLDLIPTRLDLIHTRLDLILHFTSMRVRVLGVSRSSITLKS
jgi:hypothetical protein